jgi:ABC-2 type transport system permease protein
MRNVLTLFRREINASFFSPMAYIAATFFLFISGIYFYNILVLSREVTLRYTLESVSFFLMSVTPLVTMRLFAEEKKSGTMEVLMTAPVSDLQVVLGKFLGAMGFLLAMLAPTGVYVFALSLVGDPDYGAIISAYVGMLLMGGLFASIGLFVSSLTSNQIVAAIVTFISLISLWIAGYLSLQTRWPLSAFLDYMGAAGHLDSFLKGVIDTRDVIYYLSLTAYFLFLSVRSLETRRWR